MTETVQQVLEREHHEIDAGIEPIVSSGTAGPPTHEPLRRAVLALRRHIYAEEELLFPPMREAGLHGPVMVMLREHAEMWRVLDAVDAALGVDDAAVATLCREVFAQLQSHNMKEEGILYPQIDALLSDTELETLRTFLTSSTLPDGWVAQLLQT